MFEALHFLRPEWLWALLPVMLLAFLLISRQHGKGNDWSAYVDAHLLQYLSIAGSDNSPRHRWLAYALSLAALAAVIGLAGPTWKKIAMPSYSGGEATVIVLSLAQSMNADDIKPSRLKRAEHKIRDILQHTKGQPRGLVIYSDTAFIAAPLTHDAKVITQMLPELSTTLMPVLGNRLDLAITEAIGLLQRGQAVNGRIIVLADSSGDQPEKTQQAAKAAQQAGYQLSVLAVGSSQGAVLQTAGGQAITTRDGQRLTTRLDEKALQQIAAAGGAKYAVLVAGDNDLQQLLTPTVSISAKGKPQDFQAENWLDNGFWLLIPALLLLPLLFRRGVVFALILFLGAGAIQPQPAMAAEWWDNLWQTPNQQGQQAFNNGHYNTAAKRFTQADWQASAQYKAADYAAAAKQFADLQQFYNQGNALAHAGELQAALNAYNKALKNDPDNKAAIFNRDLVKKWLNEQQQHNSAKQHSDKQNSDKQNSDKQNNDKQNNDKQNSDKQNSDNDKQNSDKHNNDKHNNDKHNNDKHNNDKHNNDKQNSDKQNNDKQNNDKQNSDKQNSDKQNSDKQNSDKQNNDKQNSNKQNGDKQHNDPSALPQWTNQVEQEAQPEKPLKKSENKPDNKLQQATTEALDQATEQQLRRVPDDPSGLLRARIRQHYQQR